MWFAVKSLQLVIQARMCMLCQAPASTVVAGQAMPAKRKHADSMVVSHAACFGHLRRTLHFIWHIMGLLTTFQSALKRSSQSVQELKTPKGLNREMKQNVPFDSLPLSSSPSRAVWPRASADAACSRSNQLALLVMPVDPLAFQEGLPLRPCPAYTHCTDCATSLGKPGR